VTRQTWTITGIEPTATCAGDGGSNASVNGDCFEADLLRGSERRKVRVVVTTQAMTFAMKFLLREGILDQEDRCAAGRALVRTDLVGLLESRPAGQWEPAHHQQLTIDRDNVTDICKRLMGTLAVSD
jgi:hypothetical protein